MTEATKRNLKANKGGKKPKRPLSAYNLFFQDERIKLLESLPTHQHPSKKTKKNHGKIGFTGLARTIADKWKVTCDSTKTVYDELAAKEKRRYALDLVEWLQRQEKEQEEHSYAPPVTKTHEESTSALGVMAFEGYVDGMGNHAHVMATQEKVPPTSMRQSAEPRRTVHLEPPSPRHQGHFDAASPPQQSPFDSSMASSAGLLTSFLEQPGMMNFVTQMYSALSQNQSECHPVPTHAFSQPSQARENATGTAHPTQHWSVNPPPQMMTKEDPILGNFDPIECFNSPDLDEDCSFLLNDIFDLRD